MERVAGIRKSLSEGFCVVSLMLELFSPLLLEDCRFKSLECQWYNLGCLVFLPPRSGVWLSGVLSQLSSSRSLPSFQNVVVVVSWVLPALWTDTFLQNLFAVDLGV